MINHKFDDSLETLFPYKFNLRRQGGNDRVFTEDINDLETLRYEILRSFNFNQNTCCGCPKAFNTL